MYTRAQCSNVTADHLQRCHYNDHARAEQIVEAAMSELRVAMHDEIDVRVEQDIVAQARKLEAAETAANDAVTEAEQNVDAAVAKLNGSSGSERATMQAAHKAMELRLTLAQHCASRASKAHRELAHGNVALSRSITAAKTASDAEAKRRQLERDVEAEKQRLAATTNGDPNKLSKLEVSLRLATAMETAARATARENLDGLLSAGSEAKLARREDDAAKESVALASILRDCEKISGISRKEAVKSARSQLQEVLGDGLAAHVEREVVQEQHEFEREESSARDDVAKSEKRLAALGVEDTGSGGDDGSPNEGGEVRATRLRLRLARRRVDRASRMRELAITSHDANRRAATQSALAEAKVEHSVLSEQLAAKRAELEGKKKTGGGVALDGLESQVAAAAERVNFIAAAVKADEAAHNVEAHDVTPPGTTRRIHCRASRVACAHPAYT